MRITGRINQNILSAVMITALLFLFGTPAHADVAASPSTVQFGSQSVGVTSAPITVTLTNTNSRSVTISSDSLTGAQFSFSGPALPITLNRGQSLTASVTFTPPAAQAYSGTLVFTRSNGSTTSVALNGTGILTQAQPPTVTSQPASQTVIAGQTATLSVGATGTAPMTYQWNKNAAAISGATSSSYTTPAETTADNNAQFTVTVSDSVGNVTSAAATLTVNSVSPGCMTSSGAWTNSSLPQTATGSFRVTFDATPSVAPMDSPIGLSFGAASDYTNLAAIVWFNNLGSISARNGSVYTAASTIPYSAGTTYHFILDVNTASHTYNAYVMIGSVQTTIGSNYAFRTEQASASSLNNVGFVSNVGSDTVCNVTLSMTAVAVAPSITTQPVSQTATAGQTATFSVAATGTAPMTYQWNKNTAAISGATSSSYTTPAETTSDNNATFAVTITNSMGNATSNAATLTVNAAAVAPAITTQPSSQTVNAGQTATFNVAATGTSPMTYQWKKSGTAISGATSSTYTTPVTTASDNAAQFTVVLSNAAGSATSSAATLTVNTTAVAPAITTQPIGKTVTAGQTATFSVVATGTSPMTYQWMKNTAAISGATSSSYTTPAETTADNNAQFTGTVSNSAGTATSNAATLTVNATTLILNSSSSSLSFGSVNVSSSSNQTVTLTNAGTSSVTISNVTVSGAGFNASGVSTGLILSPGQTATLTATFSPSAAGAVTGSVAVASNASNSPDSITLSGTGVAVVNHSAALSWTASTSTVVGYNTYSSMTTGGPYTKLSSSPTAGTTYTDTTVQAGLTYYYIVTAVDSSGTESVYSNQISATIP